LNGLKHLQTFQEIALNNLSWVVKGEKEYLIPYIEDVVKDIDIETKTIKITPMEGLLD
jgi:ribosomal 30S subunit maturation factor RimM